MVEALCVAGDHIITSNLKSLHFVNILARGNLKKGALGLGCIVVLGRSQATEIAKEQVTAARKVSVLMSILVERRDLEGSRAEYSTVQYVQ